MGLFDQFKKALESMDAYSEQLPPEQVTHEQLPPEQVTHEQLPPEQFTTAPDSTELERIKAQYAEELKRIQTELDKAKAENIRLLNSWAGGKPQTGHDILHSQSYHPLYRGNN